MDKTATGQRIRKLGADAIAEGPTESGEVWISPKHWKSMSDDNKAVVVDLYHRHRGYNDKFPFKDMVLPSVDQYSVGITFSVGNGDQGLRDQAIMVVIKEMKIPHLIGTYEEIRKGKEKLVPKKSV